MDKDTPVVLLIAAATVLTFTLVASSVIEAWAGRRVPFLARLGLPQSPRMPALGAGLWLVFVLAFVVVLQIVVLSAVIGPNRPPVTRVIGALEIGALGIWVIQMIRFVRGGRDGPNP